MTSCPETTMTIKGHRTRSLLDLGSEINLRIESYVKPLIPPSEHDTINAHNLFILRGVEEGGYHRQKYFTVDLCRGGGKYHS